MLLTLAALPIAVPVCLLLVLRQPAFRAGLAGMLTALAVAAMPGAFRLDLPGLADALGRGALTTMIVAYVLLGGFALYQVLSVSGALTVMSRALARALPDPAHRLLTLIYGVSVFFESATGFGIGIVVVAPLFLALGHAPLAAAFLALLGQCAVPWGALAIGTVLGVELAGVSLAPMGADSVVLGLPLVGLCGVVALAVAGELRPVASRALMLCLYVAVLGVTLWSASLWVAVELAGCLGGLAVLGFGLIASRAGSGAAREDGRAHGATGGDPVGANPVAVDPTGAESTGAGSTEAGSTRADSAGSSSTGADSAQAGFKAAGFKGTGSAGAGLEDADSPRTDFPGGVRQALVPVAFLIVALLVTRLVPDLESWFQAHAVLRISRFEFGLPLVYHPGFWMLVAAGVGGTVFGLSGAHWARIGKETLRGWLLATLAVAGFICGAQVMVDAGMTAHLAQAAVDSLGRGYAPLVPWIGALGGFLTASNAGANAMFMQLHLAASQALELPMETVAAAQNVAASNATLASPGRVVLAAAVVGCTGQEHRLMRPALAVVAVGTAAATGIVMLR